MNIAMVKRGPAEAQGIEESAEGEQLVWPLSREQRES